MFHFFLGPDPFQLKYVYYLIASGTMLILGCLIGGAWLIWRRYKLDSLWKDFTTLPNKMKNVVNGSLFLSDDPSRNVPMISIKKQCIQWYKLKRNKIVVGAISILFCLSLTLLFVAIHLVTSQSSGEKLNIIYDLLNIMYVPYMENVGLLLQMIVYVIIMIT